MPFTWILEHWLKLTYKERLLPTIGAAWRTNTTSPKNAEVFGHWEMGIWRNPIDTSFTFPPMIHRFEM